MGRVIRRLIARVYFGAGTAPIADIAIATWYCDHAGDTCMAWFSKLLLALVLSTGSMADTAQQRVTEPAELVFGRADSEIALKTRIFRDIFGDEHFDWKVDLEEGVIRFTSATKVVSAPVQVIGTYNTLDGTSYGGGITRPFPNRSALTPGLPINLGPCKSCPCSRHARSNARKSRRGASPPWPFIFPEPKVPIAALPEQRWYS